jgi:hypothetical protein
MNNKKITFISLVVIVLALGLAVFVKTKHTQEAKDKALLAEDSRKAVGQLMFDIRENRDSLVRQVPANGEWRNCHWAVAQNVSCLRLRRTPQSPDILEVQMQAKKNVSLTFEVRVRMTP